MRNTTKIMIVSVLALGIVGGGTFLANAGANPRTADPFAGVSSSALALSSAQQAEWNRLAELRAVNQQAFAGKGRELRILLNQELAQPEPELARFVAESERAIDEALIAARSHRDEMLAFYSELSSEQKQLVAEQITGRLNRWDRMRARIQSLL